MRIRPLAAALAASLSTGTPASSVEISIRPELRPTAANALRLATAETATAPRPGIADHGVTQDLEEEEGAAVNQRFQFWIRAFRERAEAQGIDAAVLDDAFRGVRFDAEVIRRDRNQSEFTKTIWDYLDSAVSASRIENGRAALAAHRTSLEEIEAKYGVEKEVVVAIWGLESAYGTHRGSHDVIASLATLAFEGRRAAFFEEQLIAALKILQSGDTAPRNMTGSWAGAMGHTQFIPTSYLAYAVDFTGDGRRDIWSEDPSDALASTAAYLARSGWRKGQPWGIEVTLPDRFDFTLADRKIEKPAADWARLGVTGADGRALPDHGPGAILLPAGGQGAAFLVYGNFAALERYNTADAYVIVVGHLADRIAGAGPIRAAWPRGDRALTLKERKEMQERLTAKGFSTQGIDGRIGPNTIAAVRAFQLAEGLTPDGYASLALLTRLR